MVDVIDTNFNLHACTVPGRANGMEVFHSENLTCVDSRIPCDTFNIIHITNGQRLTKDELSRAMDHFREKDFPFCIWINQENLTEQVKSMFSSVAVTQKNIEPGMILDLSTYHPVENELHRNIRVVKSREDLDDYARVIATNWVPPDVNVIRYYDHVADEIFDNAKNIFVTYYLDYAPVSVMEMFPSDERTVGLYGLATVEHFRGRGIGSAMMTYSLNKLQALGYDNVILQASEDGIGIYTRFGFKVITRYYEYA